MRGVEIGLTGRYNSHMDLHDLVLQNRILSDEVQRRIDQLSAVATVAASISQSLDLNDTLELALQAVLKVTGAQAGGISLIEPTTGELVLRAQHGWMQDFVRESPMRIPLGRGLSGQVIRSDEPVVRNRLDETQELAVPSFHNERFRSLAMAPMHARGKVIGILSIMSPRPDSFDDSHVSVLQSVADTVGVALDNAQLYERSQESQQRLAAVLQSSADGIIATDRSGHIRLVNSAAAALLGVPAADLVGQPLRGDLLTDFVRDSLILGLEDAQADRIRTFRISTASGKVLSVQVSRVSVPSQLLSSADVDGWVIVLQDVTLQAELENTRAAFIRAAAHDMRNPLSAALNAMTMVQRLMTGSEKVVQEMLEIAQTGISRVQGLIDDLVSLEQLKSSYEIHAEPVDIGELIYEVSAVARARFALRSLSLNVEVDGGSPPLLLDRKWVARAIHNYLDNAMKYTPDGAQIRLRAFTREATLHIEVADDGAGLPPEVQAHLFERFYRANASGNIPGMGLGLAMVRSIAEAHGGAVYVASTPGAGSTFGISLPIRPASAEAV